MRNVAFSKEEEEKSKTPLKMLRAKKIKCTMLLKPKKGQQS